MVVNNDVRFDVGMEKGVVGSENGRVEATLRWDGELPTACPTPIPPRHRHRHHWIAVIKVTDRWTLAGTHFWSDYHFIGRVQLNILLYTFPSSFYREPITGGKVAWTNVVEVSTHDHSIQGIQLQTLLSILLHYQMGHSNKTINTLTIYY